MRVTVLHVPDCPGLDPLLDRLHSLLSGRDDVLVETTVVASPETAARFNLQGSPTLLIDGVDPFPSPNGVPGLACRIYPGGDEEGRIPSLSKLAAALQADD